MRDVIAHLADGRFHSGEELAAILGVTRAAVWKQLKRVAELPGIQVDSVRGRGYRIRPAIELLDDAALRDAMSEEQLACIESVELALQMPSTNSAAMAALPGRSGTGRAWFTELQTAGRGRRGRHWVSGFASDLTFSLGWRFDLPLAQLAGLSLVAGVVLCEVLEDMGVGGHGMKWPNDVLVDGRKLAGILVEAAGESDGPASAAIGVGINLAMPEALGDDIDQAWTSLALLGVEVPRNRLAGHLLGALAGACERFGREGLGPFVERWREHDLLAGTQVDVHLGETVVSGLSHGITDDGGIAIETLEGTQVFHAGEVTVRGRA